METFTVEPAAVYFTIIQAINAVPPRCSVPGERGDARGPRSAPASDERGLRQRAQPLARRWAARREEVGSRQIPGVVFIGFN